MKSNKTQARLLKKLRERLPTWHIAGNGSGVFLMASPDIIQHEKMGDTNLTCPFHVHRNKLYQGWGDERHNPIFLMSRLDSEPDFEGFVERLVAQYQEVLATVQGGE